MPTLVGMPKRGKIIEGYTVPGMQPEFIVNLKISIMKTVITILAIVFTGIIACDTPEGTTTNPSDTTSINRDRTDTTMQNQTDTTMRTDSIPGR